MAVERIERLLRGVSGALNAAGLDYAVIGGNAVAIWVGTRDKGAIRNTKDVDILIRRDDLDAISNALTIMHLTRIEVFGVTAFVDEYNPSVRDGVHVLFADEKVRPHDVHATPSLERVVQMPDGMRVIDLPGLLRMKLLAFRRSDQVHIEDMLRVGLIDENLAQQLPSDLLERLREVRDTMEWDTPPPVF